MAFPMAVAGISQETIHWDGWTTDGEFGVRGTCLCGRGRGVARHIAAAEWASFLA